MENRCRYRTIAATVVLVAAAIMGIGVARGFGADGGSLRGAGPPDPPPGYRGAPEPLTGPSIVKGQPAGIEVGQCPPDFQLEPVQPYADLKLWLGQKAPQKVEDLVMLSDFVGKTPIVLLFGSYT